jgi:uncharacterized protein DUF1203
MLQVIQTKLRIVAMPTEATEHIRESLRDEYGNVIVASVQHGSGPCRHCLRYSEPGEPLLLFSYRPFGEPRPYQEVGPVFIHAGPCTRHVSANSMPDDFADRPVVLRPYDKEDNIADSQRFADAGEAAIIARELLSDANVAYVHARSRSHGCYLFRIERDD